MIALVQGQVASIREDHVVILVGGIGWQVFVPAPLARSARLGHELHLYTTLIVREDALSLYGFESEQERDFFLLVLGVNGVGPRMALAMLSALTVDAMRRAVLSEQAEVFARVPGVGKKTAQKILLHLQGRVGSGDNLQAIAGLADVDGEVLEALTALGYSVVEAQAALQSLPREAPQDVETRLRLALQYFSG